MLLPVFDSTGEFKVGNREFISVYTRLTTQLLVYLLLFSSTCKHKMQKLQLAWFRSRWMNRCRSFEVLQFNVEEDCTTYVVYLFGTTDEPTYWLSLTWRIRTNVLPCVLCSGANHSIDRHTRHLRVHITRNAISRVSRNFTFTRELCLEPLAYVFVYRYTITRTYRLSLHRCK